jgi:ribosomal protein S18 acetylase RimI-like enzyme
MEALTRREEGPSRRVGPAAVTDLIADEEQASVDRWTVPLAVTIRRCEAGDLPKLEWFGRYAEFRGVFREVFERQERDEVVMLVAEANHYPIGQVWIDLTTKQDLSIALIFAVRVLPCFQNLGIGTRLMAAAENVIRERDLMTAELGVDHENLHAKRRYERLGFAAIDSVVDGWRYTRPDGVEVSVVAHEWVMRKPLL